jgi:hypothetical protein
MIKVFKKQTPSSKEVKSGVNSDASAISLALEMKEMSVKEYYCYLLTVLNEKLAQNVLTEDKANLDVHKWVWDGDILPQETDPDAPEMVEKLRPD